MIVKCSDCHASYSVDDSKVTNKKFGFSCPKCGTNVIIDNRLNVVEDAIFNQVHSDFPDDTSGLMDDGTTAVTGVRGEEEVQPDRMPSESEISSILDEFEDDISDRATGKKQTPPQTDDFMDFDLSSDDEKILRGVDSGKITPGISSETTSSEDESITLEDFESTEGLELELGDQISDVSADGMNIRLDDLTDSELRVQMAPRLQKQSAGSISRDSTHVSQDDFKPLEEDLVLDDLPSLSSEEPNALLGIDDTDVKSEDILKSGSPDDTDDSITIDLDSLDIQLDEGAPEARSGEAPPAEDLSLDDFSANKIGKPRQTPAAIADDDQNVTLDLDTLDITLDEVEEFKEGVSIDDEDERLTLDDAGITIDQLEAQKTEHVRPDQGMETDEELKLTIDEIDPTLSLEDLEVQNKPGDSLIAEMNADDLPEIDFDKLESEHDALTSSSDEDSDLALGAATFGMPTSTIRTEDYLDIETKENFDRYKEDIEKSGSKEQDTVPKGAINFSIDYSLSHSRFGALLRLLGLYPLALIPHYITLTIYTILSQILGTINWIIVLFTGNYIDDFIEIQEKTLRYMLSLTSCQAAVVEEMPVFAGKEDIDHALQFNAIYPSKPSRFLAIMRLSIIGIHILLLPHLIILTLLSLGSIIITIIGLISIIALKRWPNILFDFMVRYFRYVANVVAFLIGIVDKYPTFRFE